MSNKMWKSMVLLTGVLTIVICDADESEYTEKQSTRKPRFISFETTDDNIRVDLDFSIPFLSIPIKRTLESTIGSPDILSNFPTVNFNVAGAVLGGAVVLASTFLLPLFLKTTAAVDNDQDQPYARFLETSEFHSDTLLSNMNTMLTSDHRVLSCLQRFVCWTAKNYPTVMNKPGNSKGLHILKEMTSNVILSNLLNGTAIEAAAKAGSDGSNCTKAFDDCPVSRDNMKLFMTSIAKFGKV